MKTIRNVVILLAALAVACVGQSNKTFYVSPDHCQMTAATTAFTAGPALVRAAANNLVLQGTTNTTAGTVTVTCQLNVAGRLGNSNFKIQSVSLYYGIQTTAMASIAAATVDTVTYASAGGSAAGTVAAAGGSLTVTPGTLQLTTTTTGQCFNERIVMGTPFTILDHQTASIEQVFTTAGTTATVLQICAIQVNYTE